MTFQTDLTNVSDIELMNLIEVLEIKEDRLLAKHSDLEYASPPPQIYIRALEEALNRGLPV